MTSTFERHLARVVAVLWGNSPAGNGEGLREAGAVWTAAACAGPGTRARTAARGPVPATVGAGPPAEVAGKAPATDAVGSRRESRFPRFSGAGLGICRVISRDLHRAVGIRGSTLRLCPGVGGSARGETRGGHPGAGARRRASWAASRGRPWVAAQTHAAPRAGLVSAVCPSGRLRSLGFLWVLSP